MKEAGLENVAAPTCDVADSRSRTAATLAASPSTCASTRSSRRAVSPTRRWAGSSPRSDPTDPKGTSDEAAALKDDDGKPVANGARNTWVTETALATALNVSYMAEQIALFGLIVGIALLLSGIGFVILAVAVLGGAKAAAAAATPAPRAEPVSL